jgi:hypothetical protein
VRVDRDAAEQVLLEGELAEPVQQFDGRRGDLRADPVAGEQRDGLRRVVGGPF